MAEKTMVGRKAAPKKKHKIERMVIERASNGFTTSAHHPRPEPTKKNPYPDAQVDQAVHETPESMLAHVANTFGVQQGQPAAEPDGDEGDGE